MTQWTNALQLGSTVGYLLVSVPKMKEIFSWILVGLWDQYSHIIIRKEGAMIGSKFCFRKLAEWQGDLTG